MLPQAEHAFGNHVEVHFGGAAFDGIAFGAQHGAGGAKLAGVEAFAAPAEPVYAKGFDHQFGLVLIELGTAIFQNGCGWPDIAASLGRFHTALDGQSEGFVIHHVLGQSRA